MGALLCGLILVTAEGRSIDEERYNDYILRNLPTLLEEIKVCYLPDFLLVFLLCHIYDGCYLNDKPFNILVDANIMPVYSHAMSRPSAAG